MGRVKFQRRTAGGDVNLVARVDDDFRMIAILDDVSHEGNKLTLEMVDIADDFPVVFGDRSMERAVLLGRTK